MMSKKRRFFAILCLGFLLCGCASNTNDVNNDEDVIEDVKPSETDDVTANDDETNPENESQDEGAYELVQSDYDDILLGKESFNTDRGKKKISDVDFNGEILYYLADVDNDSEDELFLKGRTESYVIDEKDGQFYEVYVGRDYDLPLNDGTYCGIYYFKTGAAPYSESYIFTTIDTDGQCTEVINATWYDGNENDEMDDDDLYFLDAELETKVTKNEWLDKAGEYQALKDTSIDWFHYNLPE